MFTKCKAAFSARPKLVRTLAVVLALAIAGSTAYALRAKQAGENAPAGPDLSLARTIKLEKGSLTRAVNVSGTVQSGAVSTVTATLTGKITSVSVKVGDKVKKGDVIATQDTGDLDKEIADKTAALAQETTALQTACDKASAALSQARQAKARTQAEQDALVNAAAAARDAAAAALSAATPARDAAKQDYDLMLTAVIPAQNEADSANAAKQAAYESWVAAGGKTTLEDSAEPDPLFAAYQAAEQTANEKNEALSTAKGLYNYDLYANAWGTADKAWNDQKAVLGEAQAAYDQTVQARQKALDAEDRTIADLIEQVTDANTKKQKGADKKELNELQEKKKNAVLRAESDGEVTDLKVTVGSVPKEAIATIQSTSDLVLAVRIAEADINRVQTGLPARISSDAISTPANGTLSRVSPTADTSDTAGGFSADITILDTAGLHIGSKAKAEIVLSTKDNVFTVPIDAVGTDEAGENYILLSKAGGEQSRLPVTCGEKNDYSVEISGAGLAEGLEVQANADWAGLADSAAANQATMMGGF